MSTFSKRYADPTKLFEILFQCMKQEMALRFVGLEFVARNG